MARILVTDGEQRSALAVVRSLGRAGHHVVVCGAHERPLASASRFCATHRRVPSAWTSPEAYGAALSQIVDEEGIDVVIPITDASAPFGLDLRERRPDVAVAFPERAAYERASDKRALLEMAGCLGVPVPKQWTLHTPRLCDELDDRVRELGFPLVLKPSHSSVRTTDRLVDLGVQIVLSSRELNAALEALPEEAYPVLLQQRVVGPGTGAFMLADEGRAIAWFGHRRIREKPPTGGASVYREGIALRDEVRDYSERLLQELRWTGVAMVEFKEDAATGVPYLMEINGRFWGSLQLAIDSGVDFPRLLVDSVLGQPVDPVTDYRVGLRSRWLWGDVDHLLWMLRTPRAHREAHPMLPTRARSVARFLLPWRPGDRFEILRASDPAPFFRESVEWVRHVLRRLR